MYNQSLYMNKSAFKRFNLYFNLQQQQQKNKHVNGLIKLNDNKMVVFSSFMILISDKKYFLNTSSYLQGIIYIL